MVRTGPKERKESEKKEMKSEREMTKQDKEGLMRLLARAGLNLRKKTRRSMMKLNPTQLEELVTKICTRVKVLQEHPPAVDELTKDNAKAIANILWGIWKQGTAGERIEADKTYTVRLRGHSLFVINKTASKLYALCEDEEE